MDLDMALEDLDLAVTLVNQSMWVVCIYPRLSFVASAYRPVVEEAHIMQGCRMPCCISLCRIFESR
jgi:hypothetical protein